MDAVCRILPAVDLRDGIPAEVLEELSVGRDDFLSVMERIQPSALREIMIQVPVVDHRGRRCHAEVCRRGGRMGTQDRVARGADILGRARRPRVILATVHRDDDTADDAEADRVAFCRHHRWIHGSPERRRRRRMTLFRSMALRVVFGGPDGRSPRPLGATPTATQINVLIVSPALLG